MRRTVTLQPEMTHIAGKITLKVFVRKYQMNATKSKTRQEVEQQLSQIIHKLPLERVTQVVDFARFIETQTEAGIEETETEQEIQASEAKWDELFARPEAQAKMLDMANEALAEDEAGLTHEMEFDKEGNIVRPSNR